MPYSSTTPLRLERVTSELTSMKVRGPYCSSDSINILKHLHKAEVVIEDVIHSGASPCVIGSILLYVCLYL